MIVTEVKETKISDLADRIRNAIERYQAKKGVTFKSVSEKIGMSTNNLYRIQKGKNESISLEQLLKIEQVILFPQDYPNGVSFSKKSLFVFRSESGLPLLSQSFQSDSAPSEEAGD